VEKLIKGAESVGRHPHRDGTLILVAYRHALRVSELVSLHWDQIDFVQGLNSLYYSPTCLIKKGRLEKNNG